jgi:hypothetical protein
LVGGWGLGVGSREDSGPHLPLVDFSGKITGGGEISENVPQKAQGLTAYPSNKPFPALARWPSPNPLPASGCMSASPRHPSKGRGLLVDGHQNSSGHVDLPWVAPCKNSLCFGGGPSRIALHLPSTGHCLCPNGAATYQPGEQPRAIAPRQFSASCTILSV